MSAEDYVERIKNRISQIMYENKKLFPIVNDIFISAEHYKVPEKDLEFYVRQTIESRIGLSFIVRNKIRFADDIRWVIGNDLLESVEKAVIKSILSEYTEYALSQKNIDEFNKIKI